MAKKKGFFYTDTWRGIQHIVLRTVNGLLLSLAIIAFLALVYDFGFVHTHEVKGLLRAFYSFCIIFFGIGILVRMLIILNEGKKPGRMDYFLLGYLAVALLVRLIFPGLMGEYIPWAGYYLKLMFIWGPLIMVFFVEMSKNSLYLVRLDIDPAVIFIFSFLLLVLVGTGLLLLPASTINGISPVDALFTSTSAVCVTGLIVVDTATYFTQTGKIIILMLIQAGGLGIMTFASFFGFFFKGPSSFKSKVMLKDFANDDRIGQVFNSLLKIIVITLSVEFIGAVFMFFSLDPDMFNATGDRIGFAIFHSISSFCNAGFSTLTDNLYDIKVRYNYSLHLIVAFLIIIGGLGFPIMFNLMRYLKVYAKNKYKALAQMEEFEHIPRVINVNTRIVVYTTLGLLIFGTGMFYLTEYNNVLADHSPFGKLVTAFFGSVTPRTAGFNTVNMTTLMPGTILIYLLLMWIGGSPGSTAGGIKTTAFAVALLNVFRIARGKDR
ncbi:MAG: ATPase, partial [Bacteroidota bacterium]|nr:ATPase [Bacteroidota bacterium]